ncbi:hypothetical protein LOTGIDRAFT_118637, partial [Lottia gigantea]
GVNGKPTEENFEHQKCSYPDSIEEGDVLVKMLYLSVDPALRCCMNESTGVDYLKSWSIEDTVVGLSGLGQVIESKNKNFTNNSLVLVNLSSPWMKSEELLRATSLSLAVSILGITGITAYLGITEKGHVTPGANQNIVISGAAGATGSVAGQVVKIINALWTIGICGTDIKCQTLKKELNFDGCINYKTEDVGSKLKEMCTDGVDIYFDNVGGELSDTVIKQMKANSHVILCGQIADYNKDIPYPPPINTEISQILQDKNITRERFLVLNYLEKFEDAKKQLAQWLQEGKIVNKETVEEGLENTGKAFVSMMNGGNIGKQLVHVADLS